MKQSHIFAAAYSLWVYNRVSFGKNFFINIKALFDVNRREVYVMAPFVFLTLLMGIYPEIFIDTIHISVQTLILNAQL